ncbi:MAG: hypothetical protein IJK98_08790 [Clostridia bacterium]|nr:hypothetical protein [Clostridia bacterium]
MEAVQAFIQFLVDLFSALATFLTGEGGSFDVSGLFGGLIGGGDEAATDAAEG